MKYIIAVTCFVAVALAQPDPECSRENRPKVKPTDCCKGAELVDKTVFEECQKLYPISNSTERFEKFRQGGCLIECYLNKTGILKNGVVDAAVAVTQIMKTADSSLESVIKTAVDTCISGDGKGPFGGRFNGTEGFKHGPRFNGTELWRGGKGGKRGPKPGDGPRCGHKGMHLFRCVEMNVYQNCPAAQKVTSDECTQMTNFFTKCKRPHKRD